MYGIYNAEMLEKLINTVQNIHNTTSSHEKLFVGQQSSLTLRSLYANSLGLHHYFINSLLHLRTVQDKYIALYRELITQLHVYTSAIRILAKGYLPISLVTPSKLREIPNDVRQTSFLLQHAISYIWHQQRQKSYNTISSIHTTICTMATDTVSIRNSSSSHHRPKYTSTIIHKFTG